MNVTSRWNRTKLKVRANLNVNYNSTETIFFYFLNGKNKVQINFWHFVNNCQIRLFKSLFNYLDKSLTWICAPKISYFSATARRSWELNWSKPRADHSCHNCPILKPRLGRSKLSDKWINFGRNRQARQITAIQAYFSTGWIGVAGWMTVAPNYVNRVAEVRKGRERRERYLG